MSALAEELRTAAALEELLPLFLDAAIEAVYAERGFLLRVNPEGQSPRYELEYARGFDRASLEQSSGASRTVVARVHRRGRGLVTTSEDDQDLLSLSSIRRRRVLAIVCVPVFQGGELRRILYLDHRFRPDSFDDRDLINLDRLAEYAGRAFERAAEGGDAGERAAALAEQLLGLSSTPPPRASGPRRTVLVVDDQVALREGLAKLIGGEVDLQVSAQVASREEALESIEDRRPDLVLLDLLGPGAPGLALLKDVTIRHPGLHCLFFSLAEPSTFAERCLRAGARGFLSKKATSEALLEALRRVLDGDLFVDESVAGKVLASLHATTPVATLSDRELQVFELIGQGRGTREVAETLHLSVKTIESHNAKIKKKLGLKNATELSREAVRWVSSP